LGDRAEIVTAKPPALLTAKTIQNANKLRALAQRMGCAIDVLAHRFALSVGEIDFLIIGAGDRRQLASTLGALRKGPLDPELFDAVCACQK
jgi:aryl-alcohol dehydrogenase-like predicted oxidoreductase